MSDLNDLFHKPTTRWQGILLVSMDLLRAKYLYPAWEASRYLALATSTGSLSVESSREQSTMSIFHSFPLVEWIHFHDQSTSIQL